MHSKILGQGPPIIILHGLLGTLDNWQTIANHLSSQFTVCLLDLRNHGRSPHTPAMDLHLMAADVLEFMESHWINSAVIMGHSMGGKVAMQLALEYPDNVDKLIVVDIAPKKYSPGHYEIFKALDAINLKTLKERKDAEQQLSDKLKDPSVVQFLLKNLTREKDASYSWKMDLKSIENNYLKLIGAIDSIEVFDKPCLFIRGGNSNYILDEDLESIKKNFPNTKLATIKEAGHWVHSEKPKELLEELLKFLDK
ncbi:MAG TPA: alpha/beta fold hydrolase [Saprospiraceae bacterium]|nr:alpha/beta fold hydrolase [Saprospiraceae bacterium]